MHEHPMEQSLCPSQETDLELGFPVRVGQGFRSSVHHQERATAVRAEGLSHLLQDPMGPMLRSCPLLQEQPLQAGGW